MEEHFQDHLLKVVMTKSSMLVWGVYLLWELNVRRQSEFSLRIFVQFACLTSCIQGNDSLQGSPYAQMYFLLEKTI